MTDYYPYGTPMLTSTGVSANPYKYGGKEFETEEGLKQYDFEARSLIPQIGMFTSQDPNAANYPWLNPYLYCAANPIRYIDPTGMELTVVFAGHDDQFKVKHNDDNNLALFDSGGNEVSENNYTLAQSSFMDAIESLSSSNTAYGVINSIVSNDKRLNIEVTTKEPNAFIMDKETVFWFPNSLKGGVSFDVKTRSYTQERVPEIGLIHELIHGKEWLENGTLDKTLNEAKVPRTEITTCIEENKIRSELGYPLRISYETIRNGNVCYPKWSTILPNYNFSNILVINP